MDFIIYLPKSEGFAIIIIVVDRLSKYITFVITPNKCSVEDTTKLFFKHMVNKKDLGNPSLLTMTSSLLGGFRLSCSSFWDWPYTLLQASTYRTMGKWRE